MQGATRPSNQGRIHLCGISFLCQGAESHQPRPRSILGANDRARGPRGSWDELLHRAGGEDKLLLLDGEGPFGETRGQRAIGVVYHPEYEHLGNYVPTNLSRRYDALLYVDETEALRPLPVVARPERGDPRNLPIGAVRHGLCITDRKSCPVLGR